MDSADYLLSIVLQSVNIWPPFAKIDLFFWTHIVRLEKHLQDNIIRSTISVNYLLLRSVQSVDS